MGKTDFVFPRSWEIRNEGRGFFPFVRFLVMEVSDANIGWGVGLVLPLSFEDGAGLIENNSRESIWVGDDEFQVGLEVDFTWRVSVWSCIGMRFDGKDETSS